MGEPITRRLLGAGHDVTVWNRTREKAAALAKEGAHVADTPAAAWQTATLVVSMVADDKALEAVTLGPEGLLDLEGRDGARLKSGTGAASATDPVLVDMSTVSPEASARVAEAAAAAGVDYLRAPVSGNPSVVEAGNLGIVVSGDEPVFARVESVLRDIGPNVFYLGPGEQARVMKLALNILIAGTTELLAEALVLGEAYGLDRAKMLEIMGASAVGSPFVKYKTAALVADDYSTTFSTNAMHKDVSLALATGHAGGVPLPFMGCVQQLLEGCIASGWGDADLTALVLRLRREAGRSTSP
jgi:3-hydroxyisobutyrate dehydrogenase-like beta-hydroxyacid dehydrogenase